MKTSKREQINVRDDMEQLNAAVASQRICNNKLNFNDCNQLQRFWNNRCRLRILYANNDFYIRYTRPLSRNSGAPSCYYLLTYMEKGRITRRGEIQLLAGVICRER
ncbi:hypothetical protein CDAR_402511 [Caerostris darwini]|uniref:Uncharacterized protein n=1 Tax=Caerostris darwini TaxID=1538125 RepID=A0AAV4RVL0_9ARAC|nr:hypothetical protein CDAR_402511 [Caerostris darwini]